MKVYCYKGCSTCKKALVFLDENGVEYEVAPIREQPPTKTELRSMLKHVDGNLRALFNTSGGDYKELNMKEKLPGMSEAEAIDLLAGRGNLVKRPFVITKEFGLVGFKEPAWREALGLD